MFAARPFSGNSLPVFTDARGLSGAQMLALTQELRQFETIFLEPADGLLVRARIFDLFGELPFAGHPLLGAAAVLQSNSGRSVETEWLFDLDGRRAQVCVRSERDGFMCSLDQGAPSLLKSEAPRGRWAELFNLREAELHPKLPFALGSTGLHYLVVPVAPGALAKARITSDISLDAQDAGAQFAVLFDPAAREMRHWNNDGIIEDVATGSAAGVVASYCVRHKLAEPGERFVLHQGRFAGRPSNIFAQADGTWENIRSVRIGGHVSIVGTGWFEVPE